MRRPNYEEDNDAWPADAYSVKGYRGIAWHVFGWETAPNHDTEWSGIEERTGLVVACMVGDDSYCTFEPDELTALNREEYCGGCGQIGCTHDRLEE